MITSRRHIPHYARRNRYARFKLKIAKQCSSSVLKSYFKIKIKQNINTENCWCSLTVERIHRSTIIGIKQWALITYIILNDKTHLIGKWKYWKWKIYCLFTGCTYYINRYKIKLEFQLLVGTGTIVWELN